MPTAPQSQPSAVTAAERVLVVGAGRMGSAIAAALRAAGASVDGPVGRGATGAARTGDPDAAIDAGVAPGIVLLAVPDAEIASAASLIAPGPLLGHLSGATGLDALAPHEAFSLHPLTTVAGTGHDFAGGYAAIDGGTERALDAARRLALALGLETFRVRDADRAAYHAAASIASNFLVTIEGLAEQLARTTGVGREALVPLVRAAVENWSERGAAEALTGPIARGDEATVERQRAAVSERLPAYLPLFDALVAATRELARSGQAAPTETADDATPGGAA